MAVLLNFLGCVWHGAARIEGYDNSWLTSVGMAPARTHSRCLPVMSLRVRINRCHASCRVTSVGSGRCERCTAVGSLCVFRYDNGACVPRNRTSSFEQVAELLANLTQHSTSDAAAQCSTAATGIHVSHLWRASIRRSPPLATVRPALPSTACSTVPVHTGFEVQHGFASR